MKIRSLFAVGFSLMMAQVVFAGSSNCVEGTPVPSLGGVVNTAFSCTFYEESVYPFSLTSGAFNYITDGGLYTTLADLQNNYPFPGFLVVTTDTANVSDTAAWKEVLQFVGDQEPDAGAPTGFDGSDKVMLSWVGGPAFPSLSTVTTDGYATLSTGSPVFTNSSGLQSYTILGLPPQTSGTPEPSSLLLVVPAALGLLAFKRRRA
jgi:hypothetical protein